MPAITASVTLRIPGPLLGRVDELATAEGVSRNAWLVRAVELRLAEGRFGPGAAGEFGAVERALGEASGPDPGSQASLSGSQAASVPAPAEQPEFLDQSVDVVDSSGRLLGSGVADVDRAGYPAPSVREFRPYPKGGKR